MNELTRADGFGIQSTNPLLDSAAFQQMMAVADVMAQSSLLPETLRMEGPHNDRKPLPFEVLKANCFLIANQSFKWRADPFAVAQCCSVVHGRLMFEGKLVAAILEGNLGIRLRYDYGKWDKTKEACILGEDTNGDDLAIRVSEALPDGGMGRHIDGFVGGWKTTGNNNPWRAGAFRKMLGYRGAREWARLHEPSIMLGIITDDEIDPAFAARDVTPRQERAPAAAGSIVDQIRAAKTGASGGTGFAPTNQEQQNSGDVTNERPDKDEVTHSSSADGEGVSTTSPSDIADTDATTSSRSQSEGSTAEDSDEAGDAPSHAKKEASSASDITDAAKAWLVDVAKFLWAATNFGGDIEVLKNQRKASGDAFPMPEGTPKTIIDKASSVFKYCSQVVASELEPDDARKLIAGIIGVDDKHLGKAGA